MNNAQYKNTKWTHLSVHDVDRKHSAGYHKDAAVIKIMGELLRIKSSWRNNESKVILSESADVFHESEKHVCVQGSLVRFVYHHHAVPP